MKWWKILGIVLVLYSLIGGMLIPLGPGITAVNPSEVQSGSVNDLIVTGYNTHLQSGEEASAWLRISDEAGIRASNLEPISENQIKLSFDIPYNLPVESDTSSVTLVLDNKRDGISVLPSTIRLFNIKDGSKGAAQLAAFSDFHL
ncbi:MAG: hypothetical protein HKN16_06195, partial [Saprospiraceae bacterium]|nr:hypothetical protein [Saprospiraceae bacterium]